MGFVGALHSLRSFRRRLPWALAPQIIRSRSPKPNKYSFNKMNQYRIKIPRAADKSVFECFKKLGARFSIESANHASIIGIGAIGAISVSEKPSGEWKHVLDQNSQLIDDFHLTIPGFTVIYARGGQYRPEEKSPIYDEIILQPNNSIPANTAAKIDALSIITTTLKPFSPDKLVQSTLSLEQSQLLSIHQGTLERLELLNEDLIRQGTEFRARLEEEYSKKSTNAELRVEAERKKINDLLELQRAEIEKEKERLERKIKAVDDRGNTHARREIRDKMLDDVKQRVESFGVSKNTESKRKPVLKGIAALIFAFSILLIWTAFEIYSMDRQYFSMLESIRSISALPLDKAKSLGISSETIAKAAVSDVDRTHIYWLWIRLSGYSVGLLATILFYIRWQNIWAEQHSKTELQLRQFQLDISRANWVVESCLEWRKETGSAIPGDLLGSITRNLFSGQQEATKQAIHPADELASALMGSASKLKLKLGENEIEFDKPGKIASKVKSTQKGASDPDA